MGYQPIENYGIIGNMRTTALVGRNGSIDWYCFPKHDSPSVFGAILDEEKGGYFKIAADIDNVIHKQFYWPETNVLVTRFSSATAVGEVIDFMPIETDLPNQWLVRLVRSRRRSMRFRLTCQPAFNYGRDRHDTKLVDDGAVFLSDQLNLALVTDAELQPDDRGVTAEFVLDEGESMAFILRHVHESEDCGHPISCAHADALFETTVSYWRDWLSQSVYKGLWRGMVHRSALVLKLLTYEPTGAIIAAPTTSLPETIGGGRNWDYRYTWLRDAAFTVYALLRIGFTQEAAAFMDWIQHRCSELEDGDTLQVVYSIDGDRHLDETHLEHWSGYRNSQPIRLGNAAYDQLQLDIYGELMDSVYLYNKYGTQISYDFWQHLQRLLTWVCDNFYLSDEGVWESRGGKQQYVYSKLMCWVALDRGLRLAAKRSFPADNHHTWRELRDRIYKEIFDKGWNEELQSFVQSYGGDTLDAGCLIMPLVFFMAPNDPRMIKTLERVQKPPREGGLTASSFVYRYSPNLEDGLEGKEGTFNLCTFWLVEALTRAGKTDPKYLDQARLIFEEMLSYSNHLGLYAEEMGVNGMALGNFPQAFTHIALISAAWNLNETLEQNG